MKHEYKTIYNGELIDCSISTFENIVAIQNPQFFSIIGKFRDDGIVNDVLPLLPIYEYTGIIAKNGGIFRGHLIKTPMKNLITLEVVWNPERAGFVLMSGNGQSYEFDDPIFFKSNDLDIVGHVDLQKLEV